jgi:hypothetical protein
MKRVYTNPFEFTRLVPAVPDDKLVQLMMSPNHKLERDDIGMIRYFNVHERMIAWYKRVWRTIGPEYNSTFFHQDWLLKNLQAVAKQGKVDLYSANDEEFSTKIELIDVQTEGLKFHRLKLKEDLILGNERFVLEARIVRICPVMIDPKTNEEMALYWIYFPEL